MATTASASAVIISIPNPQSENPFFPRTAPKRLYKTYYRDPSGRRQFLHTSNQHQALSFALCGMRSVASVTKAGA